MGTIKLRGFEIIGNKQYLKDFYGVKEEEKDKNKKSNSEAIIRAMKDIVLPNRATKGSAGYDIFSTTNFELKAGESINIPTGWKVYMQPDEVFVIFPRSGLGFKFFARLANSVGIVDSDYYNNEKNEGHVFVKIRNEGSETFYIKKGEAIAQGIFMNYLLADRDTATETRKGGFGSTTK